MTLKCPYGPSSGFGPPVKVNSPPPAASSSLLTETDQSSPLPGGLLLGVLLVTALLSTDCWWPVGGQAKNSTLATSVFSAIPWTTKLQLVSHGSLPGPGCDGC